MESRGYLKSVRKSTSLPTRKVGETDESFRERIEDLRQQAADLTARLEALALFALPAKLPTVEGGIDFYAEVRRFEISLIRSAMKHTRGSQTKAASLLRLNTTTLNSKIKAYNIVWFDK
jgi:DNA-binding NtrC family response regulator